MPKLQQAKRGGYFLFLNTGIVKAMNWKKGDNITAKVFRRGALLVEKEGVWKQDFTKKKIVD